TRRDRTQPAIAVPHGLVGILNEVHGGETICKGPDTREGSARQNDVGGRVRRIDFEPDGIPPDPQRKGLTDGLRRAGQRAAEQKKCQEEFSEPVSGPKMAPYWATHRVHGVGGKSAMAVCRPRVPGGTSSLARGWI